MPVFVTFFAANAQNVPNASAPLVSDEVQFKEVSEGVSVEAEHFFKQLETDVRKWYVISENKSVKVGRDDDPPHCFRASNNSYIEILPDERVTHSDKLVRGVNFSNEARKLGVLCYKVYFKNTGRYYVWVRAFSTGSEDNGIHVGIDGKWPESGKRMQWCEGKNGWTWASKQRTKDEHCGVPGAIYLDVLKPGIHIVQFSMREDGFEFDKFILTKDSTFVPTGLGLETAVHSGELPVPFPIVKPPKATVSYFNTIGAALPENKVIASHEFPVEDTRFYRHGKNWLAVNPHHFKNAQTSTEFNFESGVYDLVFVGVGENDGSSTFTVWIAGEELGTYSPPMSDQMFEEGERFNTTWKNVSIKKGDMITVLAKVGTDGHEFTRARWAGIIFTPAGKGRSIQKAASTFYPN
ncbi:MAG: hypothetical protein AAF693_02640 [Bacteroidota bacterium]